MLVRVCEPGKPAFQLRSGELGISVFDLTAVEPPLTEQEILAHFRPNSRAIQRSPGDVAVAGLQIVPILGGESLPDRLRMAHAEVRPRSGMTPTQFKQALKGLE